MSIFPNFLDTAAYSLSRSAALATSDCTARMPLPIVFTASSSVFAFRPEMATRAPSSCSRFAAANPIPLFPPVTTATFPSSRFMFFSPHAMRPENLFPAEYPPYKLGAWGWSLPPFLSHRYLDEHLNIWLHVFGGENGAFSPPLYRPK